MQMLSRTLGIQPKDVPVVVLAWQWKEAGPSIFTADKPFAEFSPPDHGLPEISSVYVSTERPL